MHDAVMTTEAVDVHTHLFPPSHGSLMLWGVDDLLTYHYLVAELFMFMPASTITPAQFMKLSTREQADIIWDHHFCRRSPLSEACRGVLTCLQRLGLRDQTAQGLVLGCV